MTKENFTEEAFGAKKVKRKTIQKLDTTAKFVRMMKSMGFKEVSAKVRHSTKLKVLHNSARVYSAHFGASHVSVVLRFKTKGGKVLDNPSYTIEIQPGAGSWKFSVPRTTEALEKAKSRLTKAISIAKVEANAYSKRTGEKASVETAKGKPDPDTVRKSMRAGQWKLAKILGWRLRLKNITPAELDKTTSGFMLRLFIPEYTPEFKKRVDGIPKAIRNLLGSDLKGKMQTRDGDKGGLIVILPVGTGMLKKIKNSDFGRKDVEKIEIEQRNMMSLRERRTEPAVASEEKFTEEALRIMGIGPASKVKGKNRESLVKVSDFRKLLASKGFTKSNPEYEAGYNMKGRTEKKDRGTRRAGEQKFFMTKKVGENFVMCEISHQKLGSMAAASYHFKVVGLYGGDNLNLIGSIGKPSHVSKMTKKFADSVTKKIKTAVTLARKRPKTKVKASVEVAKRPMTEDELKNELVLDTKKKFDKTKKKLKIRRTVS